TLAHIVVRSGTPPAAIIPGFHDVRRSAVSTVSVLLMSSLTATAVEAQSIWPARKALMSAWHAPRARERSHDGYGAVPRASLLSPAKCGLTLNANKREG